MFWRRTRAAIAGFHPLHQALIWQRAFAATQPPSQWDALAASLGTHAALVRRAKWALPERTLDVLVPLVQAVCADMAPDGALSVTADLRGPRAPGKRGPERQLRVHPPVRAAAEWLVVDGWLRLRAELRDGSTLDVAVVDRIRHRRVTKRSRSGKHKTKKKAKIMQVIKVRRALPRGDAGAPPATPPPAWVGVVIRDGRRRSVVASAKLARLPQSGAEQLDRILTVAAEPFRWTSPQAATGRRAS